MTKKMNAILFGGLALVLALSACAAPASPTPNADAIATSAVQTVEARYTDQAATQQAAVTPTFSPEPPTPTLAVLPSPTSVPAQNGEQIPCYFAEFVADISIPDGKIMLPGTTFTKTWQIRNVGSCPWDTSHKLYLDRGDALTDTTSIPLTKTVYPGDAVNLAVAMTAPTAEGVYTGYWRIATPYGGSFGVSSFDNALIVKITVAAKPDNAFAVTDVTYYMLRDPVDITACPAKGTVYTVTATITTNAPGQVVYHWNQYPYDGSKPEGGKLTFADAGKKTVSWIWILKPDAVEGIERRIGLYIDSPNNAELFQVPFIWTCP